MSKETEKEYISPTEQEREALCKQIMQSVFPLIKQISNEDDDVKNSVRHIFAAIERANQLEEMAYDQFVEKHPNNNHHGYCIDVMHIIATCIAGIHTGEEDISNYHPYSVFGSQIVAFAAASKIVEAASNLDGTLDCELSEFGWKTAKKLMEES